SLYRATQMTRTAARPPRAHCGRPAADVWGGIGPHAHANDRAGSVRYPTYTYRVFGLRPTLGRVPTFESSAPEEPTITTQLTHVQGPLARSIGDLRLGLVAMATRDARDPWWTPAEMGQEGASGPVRVAMFAEVEGVEVDPAISPTIRQAAHWLENAGYRVEEATPPRFEEAARLFFTLIRTEEKASTTKAIERLGDEPLRRART